ncbi:MAG: ECF transporter S component [Huintestinicola sp.]
MFENILTLNNVSSKRKTAYKSLVAAGLIAAAVILPQLVHIISGQPGGAKWLPMYLPVLAAGCLLGTRWGMAVGILSPVISFLITLPSGTSMPSSARLPFMIIELAVFAAVSGAFSKKIYGKGAWAFAAVVCAQLAGRAVFLGTSALFGQAAGLPLTVVSSQIITGLPGILTQALLVPLIIIGLKKLMMRDSADD